MPPMQVSVDSPYNASRIDLVDSCKIFKVDNFILHRLSMRGSRKFFQRGSNFLYIFLVNEWIQIQLKSGHHRLAFCWRADDGQTLNAGLVALWFLRGSGPVLLRNPMFL